AAMIAAPIGEPAMTAPEQRRRRGRGLRARRAALPRWKVRVLVGRAVRERVARRVGPVVGVGLVIGIVTFVRVVLLVRMVIGVRVIIGRLVGVGCPLLMSCVVTSGRL